MSHHTKSEHEPPQMFAPAELPQKSLDFVYYVSLEVEMILSKIMDGTLGQDRGHKMLGQILHDIRLELTDFPVREFTKHPGGVFPDMLCSGCLRAYNECHSGPAVCIAEYIYNIEHCQPGQ